MKLYFECKSGISGDMAVGALLDLGVDVEKLNRALFSLKMDDEFKIQITKKPINAIMATDFDVILLNNEEKHSHHKERNLETINKIIDNIDATDGAKNLAKKIFKIVAKAEAKIHGKKINEVHFHEIGAVDSIVDIVSFSVLFDLLSPKEVYFQHLTDGSGFVHCAHGKIPVPVPAVCEIISEYEIPIKISNNDGEMVTPTGAAIVAALYNKKTISSEIIIEKVGYGSGKRPYENPILRVMKIK